HDHDHELDEGEASLLASPLDHALHVSLLSTENIAMSMADERIRVRHPSLRHPRAAPSQTSELHLPVDAVHRGDHRDGDEADRATHKQDHCGFEERSEPLDL